MPKIGQRVQALIRDHIHATTIAPVTAVRATERDKLFTTETAAAVTAVSGDHCNHCFVYKFHIYPVTRCQFADNQLVFI
jgi:hypothetical protein